jgi:hypothetical protein
MDGYVIQYNAETQTNRRDCRVDPQQLRTVISCSSLVPPPPGTAGTGPMLTKTKTMVQTSTVFEVLEKIHGRGMCSEWFCKCFKS